MLLYHPQKKASAMITVLFVLTFLTGINLVISEQARQTILSLKDKQQITKTKILADEFIIENKKHKLKRFTDEHYGSVEINDDNNLTIKVFKGDTVEVEFNEMGY